MDYKVILNLMKEMNHTDLTKLEIEEEGIRICMEKAAPTINMTQPHVPNAVFAPGFAPMLSHAQMPLSQPTVTITPVTPADGAGEKPAEDLSGKKLVSPMVGTFYTASGPDKAPFVKIGDKVKKGQTICIIEAMKLMNEIEAEQDGEIVKVLAANEQMVEFGQPLFLIK